MFESRNSFCCLRKSLCIRDTRTLETWLNCFRKLETVSLGLLVTSALCFHTWGFWSNHFRLSMEFWSILIETGRQVELCFAKRNLGANETLEQTKLWKRDSVCLFVVRYAGQQVLWCNDVLVLVMSASVAFVYAQCDTWHVSIWALKLIWNVRF